MGDTLALSARGSLISLELVALVTIISTPLAALVAVGLTSRNTPIARATAVVSWIMRGIPPLIILFERKRTQRAFVQFDALQAQIVARLADAGHRRGPLIMVETDRDRPGVRRAPLPWRLARTGRLTAQQRDTYRRTSHPPGTHRKEKRRDHLRYLSRPDAPFFTPVLSEI